MKKIIIILFLLPVFCKAQIDSFNNKRFLKIMGGVTYRDSLELSKPLWGVRTETYYRTDTLNYDFQEIEWDSTRPKRRILSVYDQEKPKRKR